LSVNRDHAAGQQPDDCNFSRNLLFSHKVNKHPYQAGAKTGFPLFDHPKPMQICAAEAVG
jgi:hypothetical protein